MKRLTDIQLETNENLDINLSPLIDMVFLLLIFFMVTTVFVEEAGVPVNKPAAATAEAVDKSSIQLAITADGRLVYAGAEINLNSIRGLIARLHRHEQTPVILLADIQAPAGLLVDVIDECKLAGATDVHIATKPE